MPKKKAAAEPQPPQNSAGLVLDRGISEPKLHSDVLTLQTDTSLLLLRDGDDPDESPDSDGFLSMAQIEENLQEGISEILQAFQKSSRGEIEIRDNNINTRYYLVLAFQSEAAKNEFLGKSGWIDLGNKYLCGEEVANLMGITMTIPVPGMPNWRAKQSLAALAAGSEVADATSSQEE